METAVSTKTCTCGRPMSPPHCASCGSRSTYAKEANSEYVPFTIPETGEKRTVKLQGLRCRRCGLNFSEGTMCEAPVFESRTMRERRDKEKAVEAIKEGVRMAGGKDKYLKQLFDNKEEQKK